jgi:ABC-type oligopeptide transport system substrate-binding subunit
LQNVRIATSVLVLSVALGITAAAAAAAGSQAHVAKGGTLNVDLFTDTDYTDPALDYYAPGWELEYATALKLMNYADKTGPASSQIIPEAAAGFPKISANGKVYDFTVKAGFTKFSDGEAVTPASFAREINRLANPKLQSPGQSFITDIVGVNDVLAGKAATASGVRVKGNHLMITLTHAAPDFLARIAMPFFAAVPSNIGNDPNGALTPASAGPFFVAARTPGKSIVLKANPNYHGPRPHNVAAINYTVGNSQEAIRLRVEQGASDYAADGVPSPAYADLATKYGINKSQFHVEPTLNVRYVALNTSRPLFKGNIPLRKAVNYALDRHALLLQLGYLAGKRDDTILPPAMPGYNSYKVYPLSAPNLPKAEALAKGHQGDGTAVLYTCNNNACLNRAQIIQFDLKQIGLDVDVRPFPRGVQFGKEGNRGEPFDLADENWGADFVDPSDFINVLLDGNNIHDQNNSNFAYFNDPHYNKLIQQAALISGTARFINYGKLDKDIIANAAPWAPLSHANLRLFTSKRFGCFTYNNIYGVDLAAGCVK